MKQEGEKRRLKCEEFPVQISYKALVKWLSGNQEWQISAPVWKTEFIS